MSLNAHPVVDVHAHALVPEVEELVRGLPGYQNELDRLQRDIGPDAVKRNLELFDALPRTFDSPRAEVSTRLSDMNAMDVDVQVVSLAPMQFHNWLEADDADRVTEAANEAIAKVCSEAPGRLIGLGTVALQHPELAVQQLGYAVEDLGLPGIEISTRIPDGELDDHRLDVVWSEAERLGAVVFIHPFACSMGPRLSQYFLSNIVGNPLETTLALSRLIFGGVLDRHPALRVIAAHGGGYFPFSIGRFDKAHDAVPGAADSPEPPSHYLGRLWFDSLVFTPQALRHLVSQVGVGSVVLGTDYPFSMGHARPRDVLDALELTQDDRRAIEGGNAVELLGLP